MIQYFLQTILVSALLTLSYFVFFRGTKQFQLRRFLLILIPISSLLIPLANQITFLSHPVVSKLAFSEMLGVVNIGVVDRASSSIDINYSNIMLGIYSFISLILLLKLSIQIKGIIQLRRNSKSKGGIYFTQNTHHSFSFFGSIFIPESQKKDLNIILNHEMVHIEQGHSFDIIFFELLKVIFWFNPFNYLLKKELSRVHEFLVDQKLLEQDTDIEKYCEVLLQNSSLKYMAIGNNFNHSLTKIRFIMMTKNNNRKWIPLKVLGMIMIMSASTLIFANQYSKTEVLPLNGELEQTEQDSTFKYQEIDVKPEFPGGMNELMQFLAKNTKYPELAKKTGTSGKVFIEFVINKKGKVTDVKVKQFTTSTPVEIKEDEKVETVEENGKPVIENSNIEDRPEHDAAINSLKEEAIRVVSSMPDWSPGEKDGKKVRVSYIVPLNFKLN